MGGIKNTHLEASNLKTFGHVNMREEVADRVEHARFLSGASRAYDDMIAVGELPTPVLYSDFDFQIIYLSAVDRAIDSIHALEAARGVRFETIASLNFVNPFPWLMDRRAPRHIAIGADPFRAVPAPGSAEETAVAETELVLYPTCPPTTANAALYKLYEPALVKHRRIRLDACYELCESEIHWHRIAKKLGARPASFRLWLAYLTWLFTILHDRDAARHEVVERFMN